jgi:hypothetical protein
MPVIPFDRVVDPKRIIGKNEGPRRRRGTRGRWPQKNDSNFFEKLGVFFCAKLPNNVEKMLII